MNKNCVYNNGFESAPIEHIFDDVASEEVFDNYPTVNNVEMY